MAKVRIGINGFGRIGRSFLRALRDDRGAFDVVIVNDGSKKVAQYDAIAGTFTHKLQGVTYSRKDGLDGGVEIAKWNLPSAQEPK